MYAYPGRHGQRGQAEGQRGRSVQVGQVQVFELLANQCEGFVHLLLRAWGGPRMATLSSLLPHQPPTARRFHFQSKQGLTLYVADLKILSVRQCGNVDLRAGGLLQEAHVSPLLSN